MTLISSIHNQYGTQLSVFPLLIAPWKPTNGLKQPMRQIWAQQGSICSVSCLLPHLSDAHSAKINNTEEKYKDRIDRSARGYLWVLRY
jgi:hypothetical protein